MSTQEAKIPRLASLLGGVDKGEMHVGGIPVHTIAEQVGTPFYAYNGDTLIEKIRTVRAAVGTETEVYFSIKANPSLGVCQLVAREGVGAELASIGELHVAEKAGFPAERAIFAGPGKTNDELERAVRWGIESVNVESAGEMERLSAIAARLGKPARACLRINPKEQVKGHRCVWGAAPRSSASTRKISAP